MKGGMEGPIYPSPKSAPVIVSNSPPTAQIIRADWDGLQS